MENLSHLPPIGSTTETFYAGPEPHGVFKTFKVVMFPMSVIRRNRFHTGHCLSKRRMALAAAGVWQTEDQRFVFTRPDVITFSSESLKEDKVITGLLTAHVFALTTGTDVDWIVKLIDVYPEWDSANLEDERISVTGGYGKCSGGSSEKVLQIPRR